MGRRRNRLNKFEPVTDGVYLCSYLTPALSEFALEIYKRSDIDVEPGGWQRVQVPLEAFRDAASDILGIMRAVAPGVVLPTEADLKKGRAVAEVNKAVGVAEETIVPAFAVHRDNDNGFNVATLIIYPVCTAEGGGLDIYDPVLGRADWPIATIAARNDRGRPVAVAMRGDVPHCPAPIIGTGVRVAVVFQFPVR